MNTLKDLFDHIRHRTVVLSSFIIRSVSVAVKDMAWCRHLITVTNTWSRFIDLTAFGNSCLILMNVCVCVCVCSATAENSVFQRVWVKSGSGDFHDSQVADVKVSGEITPDVWLLGKKNKVTSGANYCANAKDFKYRKVNTSFSLSLSGLKHVPVTTPCNDSSEADN